MRAIRCCSRSLNASGLRGSDGGGATGVGPRWRERPGVVRGMRVDDGVEQAADHALGGRLVEAVPGPGAGQLGDAALVGGVEPGDLPAPALGSGAKRPAATSRRPSSAAPASSATQGCTSVWSRTLPSTGSAPRIGSATVRRSSVNSTEPSRGGSPASNLAGPVTGTKLMHVLASLRARMRHESHGAG